MNYEDLLAMKDQILADIEELKAELDEIQALLTAAAAMESANNKYWSEPDEVGGRKLIPLEEIKEEFRTSRNRAEVMWYHGNAMFHYTGFIASLTEEIDPDVLRMYSEAQSKLFAGAIVGRTWVMAPCFDAEGNRLEGYAIPWSGNRGPHLSTMRLQDEWADPMMLQTQRLKAKRYIRGMDRKYKLAGMRGKLDEFMENYPWYITEAAWANG